MRVVDVAMKSAWLAMLLASAAPTLAAESTPVEAMDLYRVSLVTDPQVSPDGKRVLFTRAFFDITTDSRQGELWLGELDGKRLDRQLLIGAGTKPSSARWSPDGKRIAYVAVVAGKPQIHVMDVTQGVGRPITTLKTAPSQLSWSPDGSKIAFATRIEAQPVKFKGMPEKPEGATWAPDAKVISDFTYRADGAGYITPGVRHAFVVPADGGAVTQLTKGDVDQLDDDSISWTPDGKAIVVSGTQRPDRNLRPRESDLFLLPIDGSAPKQLTNAEGQEGSPVVSPDGKWVAFTGFPERASFYSQPSLWVVPIGGGTPRNLTQALDRTVGDPQWNEDSRSIHFQYFDAGVARVAQVPVQGGAPKTLVNEVGGTRLYLPSSGGSYSAAKGTFAYTTLLADRPAGLGIARGGREVASVDFNADWRKGKKIGRMEEIRYKSSADGREIQGWIQFPPDFDPNKKYPLALEIHGGPNTDYGPMFSITHQLYAAAGYIVLFTNPRGSIGYGDEFANFVGGTYPGKDHDDLMSGVDAMIQRPYVDANNLFIGGGSGGGVLSTWAIGQTNRFRAASALRPVTDWTVQVLAADGTALFGKYWMGGDPWAKRDEYWQRSSLSLVGNVKTPTILITGESDYRTPITQTEQYYQALKLRGIDTMMVRLPEAGHGMGRPSQWLTSILAVVDWYDKYRAKDAVVTTAASK